MRIPRKPPHMHDLARFASSSQDIARLMAVASGPSIDGEYIHWDKLVHLTPPEGLTHEEWWLALQWTRLPLFKNVPLRDSTGQPFRYLWTDPIPEHLHHIDLGAGGRIEMPEQITNRESRDQYHMSSLMEEAITSSQLEGAATTREVAREMIRSRRAPRDRSEQMILNNFATMRGIGELRNEPLSKSLVLEIHRLITEQTLREASATGRFRRADERIIVGDEYDNVYHVPPHADELEYRMAAMCDFANGRTPGEFVHPAIRSIILHFWLAYDHPFVDGNGRTARALFYWSMLRHGFWLCDYISISRVILKAPSKYRLAFLHTETDQNDLTYFILYHLEVIRKSVEELHAYIQRKTQQVQAVERELQGVAVLNHRQRALISHALRHPRQVYTSLSHQTSHKVTPQTARTDLQDLERRGLMTSWKVGKVFQFRAAPDLEERLRNFG